MPTGSPPRLEAVAGSPWHHSYNHSKCVLRPVYLGCFTKSINSCIPLNGMPASPVLAIPRSGMGLLTFSKGELG
jgi:hypothetical protein